MSIELRWPVELKGTLAENANEIQEHSNKHHMWTVKSFMAAIKYKPHVQFRLERRRFREDYLFITVIGSRDNDGNASTVTVHVPASKINWFEVVWEYYWDSNVKEVWAIPRLKYDGGNFVVVEKNLTPRDCIVNPMWFWEMEVLNALDIRRHRICEDKDVALTPSHPLPNLRPMVDVVTVDDIIESATDYIERINELVERYGLPPVATVSDQYKTTETDV